MTCKRKLIDQLSAVLCHRYRKHSQQFVWSAKKGYVLWSWFMNHTNCTNTYWIENTYWIATFASSHWNQATSQKTNYGDLTSMFWATSARIVSLEWKTRTLWCGLTHWMELLNLWPAFWTTLRCLSAWQLVAGPSAGSSINPTITIR